MASSVFIDDLLEIAIELIAPDEIEVGDGNPKEPAEVLTRLGPLIPDVALYQERTLGLVTHHFQHEAESPVLASKEDERIRPKPDLRDEVLAQDVRDKRESQDFGQYSR
jgi:hypothetical protein